MFSIFAMFLINNFYLCLLYFYTYIRIYVTLKKKDKMQQKYARAFIINCFDSIYGK